MEEGVPSRKRRRGGRARRGLTRLMKKDNHDNSPPEPRRADKLSRSDQDPSTHFLSSQEP